GVPADLPVELRRETRRERGLLARGLRLSVERGDLLLGARHGLAPRLEVLLALAALEERLLHLRAGGVLLHGQLGDARRRGLALGEQRAVAVHGEDEALLAHLVHERLVALRAARLDLQ